MVDRVDVQNVLNQIRSLRAQTQSPALREIVEPLGRELRGPDQAQPVAFKDLFVQAVNNVNDLQKESRQLAQAFEVGDPNVSLTQVMIAAEKASVSFQAATQVRNKVVSAYQDIMNMPL